MTHNKIGLSKPLLKPKFLTKKRKELRIDQLETKFSEGSKEK